MPVEWRIAVFLMLAWTVGCRGAAEGATAETPPPKKSLPKTDMESAEAPETEQIKKLSEEIEAALSSQDWGKARQLINKGIALTSDKAGLELPNADLLLKLGDLERDTGNETEARRYYTDAMAVFHVHKNDPGSFRGFLAQGRLEVRRGDYAAAARQFSQAEALIPKLADRALVAELKLCMGRLAARQVKQQEAYNAYVEAIVIYEATDQKKPRAETLLLLASAEDELGQLGPSKQSLEKAVRLFAELKDLDGKARALYRLAAYAEREQQYVRARKLLEEVYAIYKELDEQGAAANVERHLNALPMPEAE